MSSTPGTSLSDSAPFRLPSLLLCFLAITAVAAAETRRVPQDYRTIQAAIDASAPGDRVLVSPGTYRERIRMKPGITVRSAGDDTQGKLGLRRAEQTIIDGNVAGAEGPGVAMAEASTLDGFTVTGVGKYDDALWKRHHATKGEEQSYKHIGKPGTPGIAVFGIENCTVVHNIVHHIGYTGIAIMGAPGKRVSPRIARNITYRNMGGGIGAMKNSTAIIEENICFENYYAGIGHSDASPLVVGNTCYGNIRAGIGISEGSRPIVRGNKCYRNRRAGIGIRTGADTSPLVEENECYENGMAGIGVRADATPIIRGNKCHHNEMAGIGCRTGARPLVEGNECYENKLAGIGCRSKAAPVIRGNRCWDNQTAGIGSQSSARPVIIGNECYGNAMAGIGTETKALAIIRDNKCYKNLMAGIGARKGARAVIADNHCTENLMAGIGIEDDAQAVIVRNHCAKNDMAGIGTRSAVAWVIANECRENGQTGIGAQEGAQVTMAENRCVENALVAVGIGNNSRALIVRNILQRSSGMPPIVAVRNGSTATIVDNAIQGGGVAGVLVEGTAWIEGNRFEGNGPRRGPGPPNFATWVHSASKVTFCHNRVDRWRHALYATDPAAVCAIGNSATRFIDTAFVIEQPAKPAHLYGNIAWSGNRKDQVVRISGKRGVVAENERRAPRSRKNGTDEER